jgi:hypothetical protein
MNWGADNAQVSQFGETYGVQYPEISGTEGNGNHVVMDYGILSYPTVIIIKPDYSIAESYIFPPSTAMIDSLVAAHGGILSECTTRLPGNKGADDYITVYPNPTNAYLQYKIPAVEQGYNMQLYNLAGQPVIDALDVNTNSENWMNLQDVKSGTYILLLRDRNGIIIDTELVIVK